jgi:hypothetical protein
MANLGLNMLFTRNDVSIPRASTIDIPISILLSFPKPNYIDPETRGWTGSVIMIIAITVTIAVFTARIWARTIVSRNFGLDDFLMSITMVPTVGLTVAAVLGT